MMYFFYAAKLNDEYLIKNFLYHSVPDIGLEKWGFIDNHKIFLIISDVNSKH